MAIAPITPGIPKIRDFHAKAISSTFGRFSLCAINKNSADTTGGKTITMIKGSESELLVETPATPPAGSSRDDDVYCQDDNLHCHVGLN